VPHCVFGNVDLCIYITISFVTSALSRNIYLRKHYEKLGVVQFPVQMYVCLYVVEYVFSPYRSVVTLVKEVEENVAVMNILRLHRH
jgi:hypothetical protein